MIAFNVVQWVLGLSGFSAPASKGDAASLCCARLRNVLGQSTVAFPVDEAYNVSRTSYFSLINTDLHPECVILPSSVQQTSRAVRTLTGAAEPCTFAIRGGGHTTFPGAASIDSAGALIDLRRLQRLELSKDRKSILVSPSQTWDQVTQVLDPHSLSVLGARVAGVGVGGAVLGCGTSFFSPRYGFICDRAEEFEVVLANGDIVYASSEGDYRDLWKALRGGFNNFGIVTSITLQTFPQGPFWGGQTFHDIETRKQHFEAHARLASEHPYDPYVHYINNLVLTELTGSWLIGNSLQYTKSDPPVPSPDVFRPFLSIERKSLFPGGPKDTLRIDNVTSISREYAALATYPKRWRFATITFAPDVDMMEDLFQIADETFRPLLKLAGFSVSLAYQPIPSVMSERNGAVDALGPIQTQGNMIYVHAAVSVDDSEKEHDRLLERTLKHFINKGEERARKRRVDRHYLQSTYADAWQNPLDQRSPHTIMELWDVSRKYDPDQVFQRLVPGGHKLPQTC